MMTKRIRRTVFGPWGVEALIRALDGRDVEPVLDLFPPDATGGYLSDDVQRLRLAALLYEAGYDLADIPGLVSVVATERPQLLAVDHPFGLRAPLRIFEELDVLAVRLALLQARPGGRHDDPDAC